MVIRIIRTYRWGNYSTSVKILKTELNNGWAFILSLFGLQIWIMTNKYKQNVWDNVADEKKKEKKKKKKKKNYERLKVKIVVDDERNSSYEFEFYDMKENIEDLLSLLQFVTDSGWRFTYEIKKIRGRG